MRMLKHVFDRQPRRQGNVEEYATVATDTSAAHSQESSGSMRIRLADITSQQDLLETKDALYDGHIVIVYTDQLGASGLTEEMVIDELLDVVQDIDGDIIKKVDGQIIAGPTSVHIDREKIGGR